MGRPKKTDGREVVSLSLPPDLADEIARRARKTGLTKAQLVRQAMSIGITVQDDPVTLARAVRDVLRRPKEYSTSTKLALHDAIAAALDSDEVMRSGALPGDMADLQGYLNKAGPYQIAENGWVCGPFTTKVHGDVLDYQISGEPEELRDSVRVAIRQVRLKCHVIELDKRPYFVYTNANMTPASIKVFQQNIMETWDRISAASEE
jgi:hypothetical protein